MENVHFLKQPELTPEQTVYWASQAEYWEEQSRFAYNAFEYAERQKEHAQRMLGELGVEHGLEG